MGGAHTPFGVLVAEPVRGGPLPSRARSPLRPSSGSVDDAIRPSAIRSAAAGRSPFSGRP
jgi:hypothetical protein